METKLKQILRALDECKINCPYLRAAILSNIEKEVGSSLTPKSENIRAWRGTSNDRIRKIFGSRVRHLSDKELDEKKADSYKFAELVYGKETRIGRGMKNLEDGDGWKFRGRGYIQLTGKANYQVYGNRSGVNLIENPDLLITDAKISAKVSINFIIHHLKGEEIYDTQDEADRAVTQAIGGRGLNLDAGYGKTLLTKVNRLSEKYIDLV